MNSIKKINSSKSASTFFQGQIETNYRDLVKLFGQPDLLTMEGDIQGSDTCFINKTDAEWTLETPAGIATIYNWKNGRNYLGDEGEEVEEITTWNVGGFERIVVSYIEVALEAYNLNN